VSGIFGPLLATALLAQIQGGTIQGKVVDEQGKPVAGAQVVFFAPSPPEGNVDPVEVRTTTNAAGQFRLTTPPLGRVAMNGVHVLAYQPGSAITAALSYLPPLELTLRKPEQKTVKVEGPDGGPVAGAIVSPRVVYIGPRELVANVPGALGPPLAVTTGADGKAKLNYLAGDDQLVAARVVAETIGSQDFQLVDVPQRNNQAGTITIRLGRTSRLTGRVRNRAGEPSPGQSVEVWSKGGRLLPPSPIGFKNGPLVTVADGSFQTPDNLLVVGHARRTRRLVAARRGDRSGPGARAFLASYRHTATHGQSGFYSRNHGQRTGHASRLV
jgi:hypothetical protein